MRLKTHGEHLVQLSHLFGAFNVYLVRGEDGMTLIDTGLPGSAVPILQAARGLGEPIVRIGITHAHSDHVGGLDALCAALPAVEVGLGSREARFLEGDMTLFHDEPQVPPRAMVTHCQTAPARLLEGGVRFGPLLVMDVPGHTPGHIAFYDPREGTLIVGDAMQTAGGVAVAGTLRPLFPFPAMATWHKPTALESARRLRALNPRRLAPGHGPVLENPCAEMDRAIERAAAR